MLTWLRRIAACICLTLAILFAMLWVRSYLSHDIVARVTGFSHMVAQCTKGIVSGKINLWGKRVFTYTNAFYQFRSRQLGATTIDHRGILGCYWKSEDWGETRHIEYHFPIWPVLLVLSVTGIVVLPAPRLRFSLFNLLALLTMVSISLGMVVTLVNASGLYHDV